MPKIIFRSGGFSLIELMVAVAIVAVLAAVAVPSYTKYIRKGTVRSAENDLVALSLNIENSFRRKLQYPTSNISDVVANEAAATTKTFPGWLPATQNEFTFSYAIPTGNPPAYSITATGKANFSGCSISVVRGQKPEATGCY